MFAFNDPDEARSFMEKQAHEAQARQEVAVDTFQNELHEFFDGLDQEQLNFLHTIFTQALSYGKTFTAHMIGQTSVYLRLKYDFCAQTGAPAGEKLVLHGAGFDPNEIPLAPIPSPDPDGDEDDTPDSIDAEMPPDPFAVDTTEYPEDDEDMEHG